MQAWIFPIRSRPAVLLAAMFVALTVTVMSGATAPFDEAAVAAAREASGNPFLDIPVQVATETGDLWYMLGLGILLMVLRRTRRVGIALMIVLVVSTILAGYIKCGVERERPSEHYEATYLPVGISRDTFALFCEGGFTASYPSGHALRSMAIAILLAYALSERFPRGALPAVLLPGDRVRQQGLRTAALSHRCGGGHNPGDSAHRHTGQPDPAVPHLRVKGLGFRQRHGPPALWRSARRRGGTSSI